MKIQVETLINRQKVVVWKAIMNIEDSEKTISAIENIEVLEKPETGMIGFK